MTALTTPGDLLSAGLIHEALTQRENPDALHSIRERVVALNRKVSA